MISHDIPLPTGPTVRTRNPLSGVCGVYKLRCQATGKIYVGASKDIARRYGDHGVASDTSMIAKAIRAAGKINFAIEIIERCAPVVLIEREQHWINELRATDPEIGFNLRAANIATRTPKPRRARWYDELHVMLPGDSTLLADRAKASAFMSWGRSRKWKTATQREGDGVRVWRVA
jgi:group I intron endonuclease